MNSCAFSLTIPSSISHIGLLDAPWGPAISSLFTHPLILARATLRDSLWDGRNSGANVQGVTQIDWQPFNHRVKCEPRPGTSDRPRTSRRGERRAIAALTAIQYGEIDPTKPAFANQDTDPDAGVNVKYGITSDLTADFTINPDFSQIESDRPQIEVNQRFPLFFSELRPFFVEGAEISTFRHL